MNKYLNASLVFASVFLVLIIRSETSRMSYSLYYKSHQAKYSEFENEKMNLDYVGALGAEEIAIGSKIVSLKAPSVSRTVHITTKDVAVTR
mgnify:CR=1 FL=1